MGVDNIYYINIEAKLTFSSAAKYAPWLFKCVYVRP